MKVEYVKNTDDDLMVANAARVSFNKQSNKFTTRAEKPIGSDEGILSFLARKNHWTPFSHVRITFTDAEPLVDLNSLDETLLAGMVFKDNFKTVRHSVHGWISLFKKGALRNEGIIRYIIEALPFTAKSYNLDTNALPMYPLHIDDDPRFVDVTMREKVPIFIARQRFKHMIGFTYNEVSRRYVDEEPEFYTPKFWRGRAENKKQGSSEEVVEKITRNFNIYTMKHNVEDIHTSYDNLVRNNSNLYSDMLEDRVAPEQARMVLPQSMFTEYYVTGSLSAWKRAYDLRKAPDAQKEIRDLAGMWNDILSSSDAAKLWNEINE